MAPGCFFVYFGFNYVLLGGHALLRQEPMDVSALGTDVADTGGACPFQVQETQTLSVQLRLAFPERIITAYETFQFIPQNFHVDRFFFKQAHKYLCIHSLCSQWSIFLGTGDDKIEQGSKGM